MATGDQNERETSELTELAHGIAVYMLLVDVRGIPCA